MSKKLITACMALVALAAFALPAMASAGNEPEITHPTGTRLATGTKITGTNIGVFRLKDQFGFTFTECSISTLTGELTKNNGTEVAWGITSATFASTGPVREGESECTAPFGILGNFSFETNIGNGVPWCMRSTLAMAEDEVQIRGNSCSLASRSITFVLTATEPARTCKYNRTEALKGSYTTDTTGDAIVSFAAGVNTEFKLEAASSEGCAAVWRIEGSWTLETDAVSASPIYIS